MMEPLVSVIIPVYKVPEEYLRKCIESVMRQTLREVEIILVDDGSPDNCGRICDGYAAFDARIIVLHQKNKGLSGARNAGVRAAHGKWITFVDGDDWIEENTLEGACREAENVNADVVIWGTVKDYNGKLVPYDYTRYLQHGRAYKGEECKYICELLLHYNAQIATAYSKLIRRDFVIKNEVFHDEELRQGAEGLEFCIRLLGKCDRILFLNYHWYHYIYNPQSISACTSEENNVYVIKCFEKIKEEIIQDKKLLSWFYNRLLYVIVTTAVSGYFHPENKLSYKDRKTKFVRYLSIPLIAEGLKSKNKKELSKQRLITLWLIKHKMFFVVSILAKVRYRQKRVK